VLLAIGLAGAMHVAFLAGMVGLAMALVPVGLDDLGRRAPSAPLAARSSTPLVTNG
jgi:hypothetical protein